MVEFLARSPNRVRILESLSVAPRSRSELDDEIPATRTTIGRTLAAFEDRGWVTATGRSYRLTHLGELLYGEIASLIEGLETLDQLEPVLSLMPDDLEFDVSRLADATVVRPDVRDPLALERHANELIAGASSIRLITNGTSADNLATMVDRLESGALEIEMIATPAVYEALASDQAMAGGFRSLLESPRTRCFRHDDLPYISSVIDDGVDLVFDNDAGLPAVAVYTRDETVVEWANDRSDRYRRTAERVDVEDFEWWSTASD